MHKNDSIRKLILRSKAIQSSNPEEGFGINELNPIIPDWISFGFSWLCIQKLSFHGGRMKSPHFALPVAQKMEQTSLDFSSTNSKPKLDAEYDEDSKDDYQYRPPEKSKNNPGLSPMLHKQLFELEGTDEDSQDESDSSKMIFMMTSMKMSTKAKREEIQTAKLHQQTEKQSNAQNKCYIPFVCKIDIGNRLLLPHNVKPPTQFYGPWTVYVSPQLPFFDFCLFNFQYLNHNIPFYVATRIFLPKRR